MTRGNDQIMGIRQWEGAILRTSREYGQPPSDRCRCALSGMTQVEPLAQVLDQSPGGKSGLSVRVTEGLESRIDQRA